MAMWYPFGDGMYTFGFDVSEDFPHLLLNLQRAYLDLKHNGTSHEGAIQHAKETLRELENLFTNMDPRRSLLQRPESATENRIQTKLEERTSKRESIKSLPEQRHVLQTKSSEYEDIICRRSSSASSSAWKVKKAKMRKKCENAEKVLCKELADAQEQLNKYDFENAQLKKEMREREEVDYSRQQRLKKNEERICLLNEHIHNLKERLRGIKEVVCILQRESPTTHTRDESSVQLKELMKVDAELQMKSDESQERLQQFENNANVHMVFTTTLNVMIQSVRLEIELSLNRRTLLQRPVCAQFLSSLRNEYKCKVDITTKGLCIECPISSSKIDGRWTINTKKLDIVLEYITSYFNSRLAHRTIECRPQLWQEMKSFFTQFETEDTIVVDWKDSTLRIEIDCLRDTGTTIMDDIFNYVRGVERRNIPLSYSPSGDDDILPWQSLRKVAPINAMVNLVDLSSSDPVFQSINWRFRREMKSERVCMNEEGKLVKWKPDFNGIYNIGNAKLKKIQRIENPELHAQYEAMKEQMKRNSKHRPSNIPLEQALWHGTNNNAKDGIIRHGFKTSFAGQNRRIPWSGKGIYFARDVPILAETWLSGADRYGSEGFIFLVNVLTGQYCLGERDMHKPPPIDIKDPSRLYDSVVDDVKNPMEFCIFDDNQAYPDYLLTFTFESFNFNSGCHVM